MEFRLSSQNVLVCSSTRYAKLSEHAALADGRSAALLEGAHR